MSDPAVQKLGDSYFVTWGQGIAFEFHHLKDHSDGLSGELSVTQDGFLVHWGRLTLSSAIARRGVTKGSLEAKPGLPWGAMVDGSCLRVQAAYRQAAPAVPLEPVAPDPSRWLVEGLVPAGETTVVFGDGGAGKSLFALGFAVCGLLGLALGSWRIAPLTRVLYLDWEASQREHAARLWGLTGPTAPIPPASILYRPMTRPVADDGADLRALVAREKVDLVICDSLGPACGQDPETAGAATMALTTLRSLAPVTRLVIAHVSKAEADRANGTSRPFGSVYVNNLARSAIEAKRNETTDEGEFTLTLTHTKSNMGPKKPQSGVRFLFDPEGYVSIRSGDPDLARASVPLRVLAQLRSGAQTAQDIGEALGIDAKQIRARLGELAKAHKVQNLTALPGGKSVKNLWGLVDKSARVDPS